MSRFKQLVAQLTSIALVVTMIVPATIQVAGADEFASAWSLFSTANVTGVSQSSARQSATREQALATLVQAGGHDVSDVTDKVFPDNTGTLWKYVAKAAQLGWVSGYADGTFRPKNSIARKEWAKMFLNAAGGTTATTGASFSDLITGDPLNPYIIGAYLAGYVKGYGDGRFGPNNPVLHQEVAVMAYRAASVFSALASASTPSTPSTPGTTPSTGVTTPAAPAAAPGALSVSLAADSRGPSLVPINATGIDMGRLELTAGTGGDITLRAVTFRMSGFAAPADVLRGYLVCKNDKGVWTRFSRGFTVSSDRILRLAGTYDWTIKGGSTLLCDLKIDSNTGAGGNGPQPNATINFEIRQSTDVESTATSVTLTGGKVATALHNFAIISQLATISFENGPADELQIRAGESFRVNFNVRNTAAQDRVQSGPGAFILFRYNGSHVNNEVKNLKLTWDSKEIGSAAGLDNQYVTFDLSNAGIDMAPGDVITWALTGEVGAGQGAATTIVFTLEVAGSDLRLFSQNYPDLQPVVALAGAWADVTVNVAATAMAFNWKAVSRTKVEINQVQQVIGILEVNNYGPDAYSERLALGLVVNAGLQATCAAPAAVANLLSWRTWRVNADGTKTLVGSATDQAVSTIMQAGTGAVRAGTCAYVTTERIDMLHGKTTFEFTTDIQAAGVAGTTIGLVYDINDQTIRVAANQRVVAVASMSAPGTTPDAVALIRATLAVAASSQLPTAKSIVAGSKDVPVAAFTLRAGDANLRLTQLTFTLRQNAGDVAPQNLLVAYLKHGGNKIGKEQSWTTAAAPTVTLGGFTLDLKAGVTETIFLYTGFTTAATGVLTAGLPAANITASETQRGNVLTAATDITGALAQATFVFTLVAAPTLTAQLATDLPQDAIVAAGSTGYRAYAIDIRAVNSSAVLNKISFSARNRADVAAPAVSAAETAQLIKTAWVDIAGVKYGPVAPSNELPFLEFVLSSSPGALIPEDGRVRVNLLVDFNTTNNSLALEGGDVFFHFAGADIQGPNGKVYVRPSALHTAAAFANTGDVNTTLVAAVGSIIGSATSTTLTVAANVNGTTMIGTILAVTTGGVTELIALTAACSAVANSVCTNVIRGFDGTTALATHAAGSTAVARDAANAGSANEGVVIVNVTANTDNATATLGLQAGRDVNANTAIVSGTILSGTRPGTAAARTNNVVFWSVRAVGASANLEADGTTLDVDEILAVQVNDTETVTGAAGAGTAYDGAGVNELPIITRAYSGELGRLTRSHSVLVKIDYSLEVPPTQTPAGGAARKLSGWTVSVPRTGASEDPRDNAVQIDRTILAVSGPVTVNNNSIRLYRGTELIASPQNIAHYGKSGNTADGENFWSLDWGALNVTAANRVIDEGASAVYRVEADTASTLQDEALSVGFTGWGDLTTVASATVANTYEGAISNIWFSYLASNTAQANNASRTNAIANASNATNTIFAIHQVGSSGMSNSSLYTSPSGTKVFLSGAITLTGVAFTAGAAGTANRFDATDLITLTYDQPIAASYLSNRLGLTSQLMPGRGNLATPACATLLANLSHSTCRGMLAIQNDGGADPTGGGVFTAANVTGFRVGTVTADTFGAIVNKLAIIGIAVINLTNAANATDAGPIAAAYYLNAAGTVLTVRPTANVGAAMTNCAPVAIAGAGGGTLAVAVPTTASGNNNILRDGNFVGAANTVAGTEALAPSDANGGIGAAPAAC